MRPTRTPLARTGRRAWVGLLALAVVAALCAAQAAQAQESDLLLWHAYGAGSVEAEAIDQLARAFGQAQGLRVLALPVPNEAFTKKLMTGIPQGVGPDAFIGQHDQLGEWARSKLVTPLDLSPEGCGLTYQPKTCQALSVDGTLYALPLAFKTPVLIYNRALITDPPATTDALIDTLARFHAQGADNKEKTKVYGLAYEATNLFYHSVWLHGFGGRVSDPETGQVIALDSDANAKSVQFLQQLSAYMPTNLNGADVKELFRTQQAAMVISGPWFLDNLKGIDVGLAPLPVVSGDHPGALPSAPFLTAEGVFLSKTAKAPDKARAFMAFLAGPDGALLRATIGGQTVAHLATYDHPQVKADPHKAAFSAQARTAFPTSNSPAMSSVWGPLQKALDASVNGVPQGTEPYWLLLAVTLMGLGLWALLKVESVERDDKAKRRLLLVLGLSTWAAAAALVVHVLGMGQQLEPAQALARAQREYLSYQRPPAQAGNPAPYIVIASAALLSALAWGARRWRAQARASGGVERGELGLAVGFMSPAVVAILVLIVAPFAVGSALSLFSHEHNEFIFVGFDNYVRLFSGDGASWQDTTSFYFTLVVTALWTALNVALHVGIGVGLALLLRDPLLRLRGIYRVLLIVPWAVPNYITALIWRGMFNTNKGAVNSLLDAFGVAPVEWFNHFLTSFTANLVTNTWLGFPFMMVVTLGALQSIPTDLEDAAAVDGATRWQRFRHITLPLLKPALLPAVILGSVWTFNMFNIIYLVSKGGPDGSTEILISESYKWAFERQFQYGYAAAYALLIFAILIGYSRLTSMLVKEEGA
jgi:arabinogalactan oligomer/maltooligosaccharide transport system permease protein